MKFCMISSEMSEHLFDGLEQHLVQRLSVVPRMNPNDFVNPLTFSLAPPAG